MRHRVPPIGLAWLLAFGVSGVSADSWELPKARTVDSADGGHAFKLLLNKDSGFRGPAEGVLLHKDKKGDGRVIWQGKLVNIPHQIFVADTGKHVVTVDTYARLGHDHALVLYGDKGKVLADYKLVDLLSRKEIADHVMQTVSSNHWASGAKFTFSPDGKQFTITLKWGRVIQLDLETGKAVPPPEPVPAHGKNPYADAGKYLQPTPLAESPLAEVYSAKALNTLLTEIQELQSRGVDGPKIELSEKMMRQINLSRGEGGGPGLLKHQGRLNWPIALKEDNFKTERQQVDSLFAKALEQAKKGKLEAAVAEELAQARETMQDQLSKQISDLTVAQYVDAKRFLNDLKSVEKLLGEPGVAELFALADQFASHGKTVTELVKSMTEKKLRFAPATVGDEAAYVALHKALVAYRDAQKPAPASGPKK